MRSTDSLSHRTLRVDPLSSVTHPLTNASLSSLSQTHRFPENSARSRAASVGRAFELKVSMNFGVNVPVESFFACWGVDGRCDFGDVTCFGNTGPGIASNNVFQSYLLKRVLEGPESFLILLDPVSLF